VISSPKSGVHLRQLVAPALGPQHLGESMKAADSGDKDLLSLRIPLHKSSRTGAHPAKTATHVRI
jgi:hypothetical protein